MRNKILLFIILSGLSQISLSQNSSATKVQKLTQLKDYLLKNVLGDTCLYHYSGDKNIKLVLDNSLSNYLNKVFDKVIIGNDDVIKNGSAANISLAEDKIKASINYSVKVNTKHYLSIGVNANLTDKVSESIFSNKNGSNLSGLGLTLKYSILYKGTGLLYSKNNKAIYDSFSYLRKEHITSILKTYHEINIDSLKKEIKLLQIDSSYISRLNYDSLKGLNKGEIVKKLDSLNRILEEIKDLSDCCAKCFYKEKFKSKIEKFETENSPFNGYKAHWFDIDLSGNMKDKYLIYDTSLVLIDSISKTEVFPKIRLGVSYNYAWNGKTAAYFSATLGVSNSYTLEGENPIDTIGINTENVNNRAVYNIGKLDNYKELRVSPYFSMLWNHFPLFNKVIGYEAFAEGRGNFWSNSSNKLLMDFRLGLVANFTEITTSKIPTVGLFVKLTDYNFSDKFMNYFSVGLRLGIPFDKFLKK